MIVLLALALSWLNPIPAVLPPSMLLSDTRVPAAADAFSKQPQWVTARFGTPATALESTCCHFFGYRSGLGASNPVLIQTYTLSSGGHLAFVYDRLPGIAPWLVVGIVYDAQRDKQPGPLSSVFPQYHQAIRTNHLSCWDPDRGMSLLSTSMMPLGRTLYVHYANDTNDSMPTFTSMGALSVLQFGYFSFSMGPIVGLDVAGDDFSTIADVRCLHD